MVNLCCDRSIIPPTGKIDCANKNFVIGMIHKEAVDHLITMIAIICSILFNLFRGALRHNRQSIHESNNANYHRLMHLKQLSKISLLTVRNLTSAKECVCSFLTTKQSILLFFCWKWKELLQTSSKNA